MYTPFTAIKSVSKHKHDKIETQEYNALTGDIFLLSTGQESTDKEQFLQKE